MSIRLLGLTGVLLLLAGCGRLSRHTEPPPGPPAVAVTTLPAAPPSAKRVPAPVVRAKPTAEPKPKLRPESKPKPKPKPAVNAASVAAAASEATPAKPAAAVGEELQGTVRFEAGAEQQVSRVDLTNTLVYYVPASGAPAPNPGQYDIYTIDRDFKPGALAVPYGSTVRFVNQDDVRHNVFSVTPGAAFNLGYQVPGQIVAHRFTKPGLVLISCNVHRSMEAEVLVVPTPYTAEVGANGDFVLRGLPAGPGKLYVWNPRAAQTAQPVRLPTSAALTVTLVAVKPRVATQLQVGDKP